MKKEHFLQSEGFKTVAASVLSILIGLAVGSIVILIVGLTSPNLSLSSAWDGIRIVFGGLFSTGRDASGTLTWGFNPTNIGNMLFRAAPLIMTGLSVGMAYKTGLFNIGATGQMVAAGLLSVITALTVDLPRPLLLPLVVLVGFLGGAVYGGIQGYLKSRFNVNEVVSGIMMNWIAHWAVYYVISDYFKSSSMATESQSVPAAASLRSDLLLSFTGSSSFNWGFILAIACVVIVQYILRRTVIGYEMRAVGFNAEAAEYGGINVKKNAVLSMAIAGALAGLAGVSYYCGYCTAIRIGVQPSHGFDGVAVALLGGISPVGVVFASIFFAILQTGKGFMSVMTKIAPEIADTIIAIIIYFAAISKFVDRYFDRFLAWYRKKHTGGGKK